MKEIRIIKTFYIWRTTGKIDTKVEIHRIKNDGQRMAKMAWIQKDEGWRRKLDELKSEFPDAKVRYFDLQKDSKVQQKYKVLSEDVKERLES